MGELLARGREGRQEVGRVLGVNTIITIVTIIFVINIITISIPITDIPFLCISAIHHNRYQISTTSADGSSVLQSARTRLRRDLGG